ncbi:hypothetical protein [Xanthomonas campestris]|uniref:hypothetical protein n=1 Tax=Xanthomonas campestris TaxID=339 RepID=UPI0024BBAA11|nr:hypothetical protein [Xanthomonas campestris]
MSGNCQKPAFSVAKTGSSGTPLQTSRPCGRWVIGGFSGATQYSPLTRQASKVTRLARATGKDAEVLNQEAELIEQWLEAQHETARQALDILNSIPGIQIEECFNQVDLPPSSVPVITDKARG